MEIHMIGHASIFVKTEDCGILMDPVLWDPHQEGLFDVSPKREVIHENLPKYEFLIISHKHQDHFDLRTLAYLRKDVDVFIPQDPLIEKCLRQLGYKKIYPLKEFSEVKLGTTRIGTTRSENPVPEFGVVIADSEGTFWNHVDTVVRPPIIDLLLDRYSQIDFLLATWQHLMELSYQMNRPLSFPFDDYGKLLNNISLIKPGAMAPGANGFKYVNGSSWLNRVVFPVTREQFCSDAVKACPSLKGNVFTLDPGDVLQLTNGRPKYYPGSSNFVRMLRDDRDELDFLPVKIGDDLVDHNPNNEPLENIRSTVFEELETKLPAFLDRHRSAFSEHRRWGVIYQLEVVFPDGSQKWFIDFSEETPKVHSGRNPQANSFALITASGLYALITGQQGWDYVMLGGYYRRYNKVYAVTPLGILQPEASLLIDLLELRFPYLQLLESFLSRETEKWLKFYSTTDAAECKMALAKA
jgi:hypothetical protein